MSTPSPNLSIPTISYSNVILTLGLASEANYRPSNFQPKGRCAAVDPVLSDIRKQNPFHHGEYITTEGDFRTWNSEPPKHISLYPMLAREIGSVQSQTFPKRKTVTVSLTHKDSTQRNSNYTFTFPEREPFGCSPYTKFIKNHADLCTMLENIPSILTTKILEPVLIELLQVTPLNTKELGQIFKKDPTAIPHHINKILKNPNTTIVKTHKYFSYYYLKDYPYPEELLVKLSLIRPQI